MNAIPVPSPLDVAIIAGDFADVAQGLGLTASDLDEARGLMSEVSVLPEALALARHGATAMHDVTRGGPLETLKIPSRLQADVYPFPIGRDILKEHGYLRYHNSCATMQIKEAGRPLHKPAGREREGDHAG